jgi:hypothetical protein
MASQITHIVLAHKVHDKLFPNLDQRLFYCGNIFPDIRYLKVIDRDKTHSMNITLKEVQDEKDPFFAGLKFHSLVDLVLEEFMQKHKVYDLCPHSKYVSQTYKLFQDELYYDKIKDWEEISNYFSNFNESKLGVPSEKVNYWYDLFSRYVSSPPSDESRAVVISGIDLTMEIADKINQDIVVMKKTPKLKDKLDEFYESFENLIKHAK